MKKLFGVIIAVIGICEISTAMDKINYYSLVDSVKKEGFFERPACPNSKVLEKKITDKTLEFVNTPVFRNKEVAERLLNEYKKLFCVDQENSCYLEEFENEYSEDLSEEDLLETADNIALLCDGLPEAATKIRNMFEVIGDYRSALIWALVSYKFGELRAEEDVGRLLVGMGR